MSVKKILYWTALILSLGLLSIIIYFSIVNSSAMKALAQGGTLHTQEELENAYNEGVNESKEKLEAYQSKIDSYKSQIVILTESNKSLIDKVDFLENDNEKKQAKINDLTNKLNILKSDFATISNENIQLKEEIEELKSTIVILQNKINNNNEEINRLKTKIVKLESDIVKYKELIQKLKPENVCLVTLKHDNQLYDLKMVQKGESLSGVLNPNNTERIVFNYWTKNNIKVDDINSEIINEDTTYVSNVTNYYLVEFYLKDNMISSNFVRYGKIPTIPTISNTSDYIFENKWTNNVNNSSSVFSTTCDVKYYANLRYFHTVNFYNVDNVSILKSIKVLHDNLIDFSVIPLISQSNYDMLGWKSSATVNYNSFIDLTGYKITEDTNFYPQVNKFYNITILLDNSTYFSTKYYVGKGLLSYLSTPQLTNCQFLGYFVDETEIEDINTYEFTSDTEINIKYKLIRATASEIKYDGTLVDSNHNAIAGLGLSTFAKSSNYSGFTISCNYNVKSSDGSVNKTVAVNERFDISGGWFYYGVKNKFFIFESSVDLSFYVEFKGCVGDSLSDSDYPMFIFRFSDEVGYETTFTDIIITFY